VARRRGAYLRGRAHGRSNREVVAMAVTAVEHHDHDGPQLDGQPGQDNGHLGRVCCA
jgi:hypothetical protein